jgi:phosphatidate cytidylyltransferase
VIGASIFSMYGVSSSRNYFLGIFWSFFVPGAVMTNDTMAYIAGRSFGKTPLIKLSPNKTMEGFIGGAFFTLIVVLLLVKFGFSYDFLSCMNEKLNVLPFEPVHCSLIQTDVF